MNAEAAALFGENNIFSPWRPRQLEQRKPGQYAGLRFSGHPAAGIGYVPNYAEARGVYPNSANRNYADIERYAKRRERFAKNLNTALFGFGIGFGVRVGFMAAAAALTIPTVVALPAAAIAASIISSVARTWVSSIFDGADLEKGWMWKSVKRGFWSGCIGATAGLVGAAVANAVVPHNFFHTMAVHAAQHVWPHNSGNGAFASSSQMPVQMPAPVSVPPTVAPPVLAVALDATSAAHTITPTTGLADFVHSNDFQHLPAKLQALGVHALRTGNNAEAMHFYKEASYRLIDGRHATAATRKAGEALIDFGATAARAAGLHDANAEMLMHDQAWLAKMHGGIREAIAAMPPADPAMHFHDGIERQWAYIDPHETLFNPEIHTPIQGPIRITSPFGVRHDPFNGLPTMHKGVDFAAPLGTPVHASMDGWVERIDSGHGYGKYILVRHADGIETRYAHLDGFSRGLYTGEHVDADQVIGYVGRTGRATGSHLYFEVIQNGVHVDPLRVNPAIAGGMRKLAQVFPR
jgi:murein DD-endopeptidase MepM/ murein hydrolase activator NlpD